MQRRVLLREHAERDTLDAALSARGWSFEAEFQPDAHGLGPHELKWALGDGRSTAHYIDDTVSGEVYLTFTGPSASTADFVSASLEVVDPSEVFFGTWSEPQDRARQAVRAGLLEVWPPHRTLASEVLRDLARDPAAEVRIAATLGMLYTERPEWIPLLEEMADQDANQSVREAARGRAGILESVRVLAR